ncbi:unnamed protein product [Anisakis simplex]|uniref:Irregular chiasm C-roughest protein n=1 Tax=Anisakis simplex TaxID=6269 RepID=A0A0M3JZP3_ANISI|nr:unnamed protein product [Anisakis simplex]
MRWLLVWTVITIRIQAQPKQRIAEGPSDTSVRLGETVVLNCRVEAQQGAVQWVKNGFGLGNDRQLSAFKRYSMEGSTSKGEYNLRISDVDIEDDDVYECQIQAAGNNPSRISNAAKLNVLVEPQPPKLQSGGSVLKATAGQLLQQSCVSERGKPPADVRWAITDDAAATKVLEWLDDTSQNVNKGLVARFVIRRRFVLRKRCVEQMNAPIQSSTTSRFFTPRSEDDQKHLACIVTHETYPSMKSQSVLLELNYAPKLEIKLDNTSVLREHGSAMLSCNVQAKPFENVEIIWYRNGRAISSAKTDTLSFSDLQIDHHQSQYVCLARNSIGESSASYIFNISYGAHITSVEQHQAVSPGEDAFFHCEAIGNPKPSVNWVKVGDNQTLARGNKFVYSFFSFFTIRSVQSWHRGEYDCIAKVDGFPPAVLTNYLHIRGAPSVSLTEEIVAGVGESVEIMCEVHQVPRQFGVESKLIIQSLKEIDFGVYNCTAINEFGQDFQTMQLMKKSVVDVMIITPYGKQFVIGAFSEVLPWTYAVPVALLLFALFLLIVCCMLWRCCRKKYKKATRFNDVNYCIKCLMSIRSLKAILVSVADEQMDVTVKCEALDGVQYFPEMYTSPALENPELMCTKDYVPIPQNNPDLDYLPPPAFVGNIYQPYFNQPVECAFDHPNARFEPSYGSFTSGMSTPAGATLCDMYACNSSRVEGPPLETLTELATPDMESGMPLLPNGVRLHERPMSRTSTHV